MKNKTLNHTKDWIKIVDWTGRVLFQGHYEDKQVDKVLKANRCKCWAKKEPCSKCNETGYSGDFEVSWMNENDSRNVYEYINY